MTLAVRSDSRGAFTTIAVCRPTDRSSKDTGTPPPEPPQLPCLYLFLCRTSWPPLFVLSAHHFLRRHALMTAKEG